jgi:protein-tyrosine phosphatase
MTNPVSTLRADVRTRGGALRRITRSSVLLALAIMTALGIWYYRQHKRYRHFAEHQPGMVYRSGWLDADTLREVIADEQIRVVLNLCCADEMSSSQWDAERRVVRQCGAKLLELPMPVGVRADDHSIRTFVDVLGNPANYPLLVHCQHGVTRTAQLLVIYDVAYRGLTARDSLRAMPLFGREDHNVQVRAFARDFERRYRALYPSAEPLRLSVLR